MADNKIVPQTLENNQEVVANKKEKPSKVKKVKAKKANSEPKRNRLKETFAELKKVTWPSFKKTMAQTGMVIGVVVIFGVLVFGVDALLSWLFSLING